MHWTNGLYNAVREQIIGLTGYRTMRLMDYQANGLGLWLGLGVRYSPIV